MENFLDNIGNLDLILLGLDINEHLGFNEPNCEINKITFVIPLSETTNIVSKKYFREEQNFEDGISLGIKTILDTSTIPLIASGKNKADIVEKHYFHLLAIKFFLHC